MGRLARLGGGAIRILKTEDSSVHSAFSLTVFSRAQSVSRRKPLIFRHPNPAAQTAASHNVALLRVLETSRGVCDSRENAQYH